MGRPIEYIIGVMMTAHLKTDENETLQVPGFLLPEASPNTEYSVSRAGKSVIIEPMIPLNDFWQKLSPEERVAEFMAWADSHKDGPGLSDWAVSRDSIYD